MIFLLKSSTTCNYLYKTLEKRVQIHFLHMNPHPFVIIFAKHWRTGSRHDFPIEILTLLQLPKLNTGEEGSDTLLTYKSPPFCHYLSLTLEKRVQT